MNGSAGPLIVACLRHCDLRPDVNPLTGAVRRYPRGAGPSPGELAALELALRIAESWHGRTLAVVAGPPAAEATLRDALAAGADVLRVDWPDLGNLDDLAGDEHGLAAVLAGAVQDEQLALVLCGDRSADRGTGALPAFLAHELGAAQALGLVSLAADGSQLLGERRLPAGRRERLRIPRPAVCSVEAAGLRLRRPPLAAELASRRAVIPVITPVVPPSRVRIGVPRPYSPRTHEVPAAPAGSPRERLLALSGALTRREPPALIGPADPGRAADELMDYLRRSGYAGRAHAGRAHAEQARARQPGSGQAVPGRPAGQP
jgi:electron transfer flavoprotein beta subunit